MVWPDVIPNHDGDRWPDEIEKPPCIENAVEGKIGDQLGEFVAQRVFVSRRRKEADNNIDVVIASAQFCDNRLGLFKLSHGG